LGSVLFYVFSRTSADPDLWGHVRFGQDLWQTGRIVREDIYSYLTGDQVWINHEWLSEAIFYFAFAAAGSVGLIAFKSGLAFLIVAFLYWHLRQQIAVALHAAILTGVFFTRLNCPTEGRARRDAMALDRTTAVSLCGERPWRRSSRWGRVFLVAIAALISNRVSGKKPYSDRYWIQPCNCWCRPRGHRGDVTEPLWDSTTFFSFAHGYGAKTRNS
jgi:hypothetical protein